MISTIYKVFHYNLICSDFTTDGHLLIILVDCAIHYDNDDDYRFWIANE